MSQININPSSGAPVPPDNGDRTAAAGINFLTVIVVLGFVVAVLWFLFSGPIGGLLRGTSDVNINVNPPAQTQPSGPANSGPAVAPAQPAAPAGAPSTKP